MSQLATSRKARARSEDTTAFPRRPSPLWYQLSISIVVLLALLLYFFHLGQGSYGNLYYAAGDRSMLTSWHNFFFVSFDPGGFVSIDKPPLGFWLQVACAKLFGFMPFSVLLPQALAGVLSVMLLAHLVCRSYGPVAGLLAAATLAITPINIVTNRSMNVDSLLILVALLAAWASSVAAETGQLRFLLLCALLIGLGFNIKMLEAYLFLPAFVLLYWFTAPLPARTRLLHLALATCLLLAISGSWMLAVDLTPATQRPYVGSSGNNSELQLALLYNGYERYSKGIVMHALPLAEQELISHLPEFTFSSYEAGNPGFLRLISNPLGLQIGWLLPFAILGIIAIQWDKPALWPLNKSQQGVALWGTWFLTLYTAFSFAGSLHAYYTALLAPAICALLGISVATAWQDYHHVRRRWFFPLTLLGTTAVQVQLLSAYAQEWEGWLIPSLVMLSLIAAGGLLLAQRSKPSRRILLISTGLIALLLAPITWSVISLLQGENTAFPIAGPPPMQETTLQRQVNDYARQLASPDPSLIRYLLNQQGKTPYLVATFDSMTAAPIILGTGKPVMALGGYQGNDHILTGAQLNNLIHNGTVRFFLLPRAPDKADLAPQLREYLQNLQRAGPLINYQTPAPLVAWISARCSVVSPAKWSSRMAPVSSRSSTTVSEDRTVLDLYDCASNP